MYTYFIITIVIIFICVSIILVLLSIALLRLVHTMKIMRIKSELICIASIHTEFALTAIHIECVFSQSTSIGGLKPISYQML